MKVKQRIKGLHIQVTDGVPKVEPVYETYFDDSLFKKISKSKDFWFNLGIMIVWIGFAFLNNYLKSYKTICFDCIVIGVEINILYHIVLTIIIRDKNPVSSMHAKVVDLSSPKNEDI